MSLGAEQSRAVAVLTQAFRVLARKTASAMSPRNGTRPMAKSSAILKYMRDWIDVGRPPSIPSQARTTVQASSRSMRSPTLPTDTTGQPRRRNRQPNRRARPTLE